ASSAGIAASMSAGLRWAGIKQRSALAVARRTSAFAVAAYRQLQARSPQLRGALAPAPVRLGRRPEGPVSGRGLPPRKVPMQRTPASAQAVINSLTVVRHDS